LAPGERENRGIYSLFSLYIGYLQALRNLKVSNFFPIIICYIDLAGILTDTIELVGFNDQIRRIVLS